jgi:hypothetical protein
VEFSPKEIITHSGRKEKVIVAEALLNQMQSFVRQGIVIGSREVHTEPNWLLWDNLSSW